MYSQKSSLLHARAHTNQHEKKTEIVSVSALPRHTTASEFNLRYRKNSTCTTIARTSMDMYVRILAFFEFVVLTTFKRLKRYFTLTPQHTIPDDVAMKDERRKSQSETAMHSSQRRDSDLNVFSNTENDDETNDDTNCLRTLTSNTMNDAQNNKSRLRSELSSLAYRYHVHHPFNALLQSGRASRDMLQLWAANRYYYQDTIPRKDALIVARCPHSSIRASWISHVVTHDIDGALGEWLHLTRALGIDDANVASHILPATKFACDAYYTFCRDATWQDGMCASMTHLFAGDIHSRRIANWPKLYPWLPSGAFDYFETRVSSLPNEIESSLDLLADYYCTSDARMRRARQVVMFKQDVLWSMLDALWHHWFARECRMPLSPPQSRQPSSSFTPPPILRVLGSGAGGGVPQWNRVDRYNDQARHGCVPVRTQSSFALSSDTERRDWILINCSPDFGFQWNALVKIYPHATLRAVVLTDNQLDHVGGLISLRESGECVNIYCYPDVARSIESVLALVEPYTHVKVHTFIDVTQMCGFQLTPVVVGERKARYAPHPTSVIGIEIVPLMDKTESTTCENEVAHNETKVLDPSEYDNHSKTIFVAPCVPTLDNIGLFDACRRSSVVLFDGTFATPDEMPSVSGHVSIDETCAAFDALRLSYPTFVHMNNTNRRLLDSDLSCSGLTNLAPSPQLQFAYDGMEFTFESHET